MDAGGLYGQKNSARACRRTNHHPAAPGPPSNSPLTAAPLHGAAPLKPLPEPADLEQHRVRRQARVGGLINEYRMVAWRG